jgi:hypothetical protein
VLITLPSRVTRADGLASGLGFRLVISDDTGDMTDAAAANSSGSAVPQGLRASDAPRINQLCQGDVKRLARLGTLLTARLAFTELALGAALLPRAGSGVGAGSEGFLMDARLKTVDAAGFSALAAAHGCGELCLAEAADGWRVVALEDELGNPLLAALDASAEATAQAEAAAAADIAARQPTFAADLIPALKEPVEGLLAARGDEARAAALERLRYAAPPLSLVGGLMPMLLADGAEVVRERAIGLLVAAGAHVAVVDTVRALQRSDDSALHRLAPAVARLAAAQQDVVVSALTAAAARGQTSAGAIAVATALAEHLSGHRDLGRLLELWLPRRLPLVDLVRAVQHHDRARIDRLLAAQLGVDPVADSHLVVLLAAPMAPAADHPLDWLALLRRGVDILLLASEEPRDRMALAAALRRVELQQSHPALATLLADQAKALPVAADTAWAWLLSELCRDGRVPAGAASALGVAIQSTLREGRPPVVVAVLEQQLPALLPLTDGERLALVEPVLSTVARFHDDRSHDVAIACVERLGQTALPALWEGLDDHPRREVRLLCAELAAQALAGAPAAIRLPAAQRLAEGVRVQSDSLERATRLAAAAKLLDGPMDSADVGDPAQMARDLAASARGLGDFAVLAEGYLGAAAACPEDLRGDLLYRLMSLIEEDLGVTDHTETLTDDATGEVTWVVEDRLARHTEVVPRALEAIGRIAGAGHMGREPLTALVLRLLRRWKSVASWQVVWGPVNVRELAQCLAKLAAGAAFPPALRVQVVETLLPAVNQLPVARALTQVFAGAWAAHQGGSYLNQLAGRLAARLVQLASEDWFVEDERLELLEVLVEVLALPDLGKETATMRKRIGHLLSARHDDLSTRGRVHLRAIVPNLEPELAARLSWA